MEVFYHSDLQQLFSFVFEFGGVDLPIVPGSRVLLEEFEEIRENLLLDYERILKIHEKEFVMKLWQYMWRETIRGQIFNSNVLASITTRFKVLHPSWMRLLLD